MTLVLNTATTVLPVDDAARARISTRKHWDSRTAAWQMTEANCSAPTAAPCCS